MSIPWRALHLALLLALAGGASVGGAAEPAADAVLDYPPSVAAPGGVDMLDESIVDETLDANATSSNCNCPPRRRVRPCYPPCDAPLCPDLPTDPNSWVINPGFDGCGCRWFRDVYCGEGCLCPPWRANIGSVILQRSRPDSQLLLRDNATLGPLANADDIDPSWTAGADVTVERMFRSGSAQFRYFGAYDGSARLSLDNLPASRIVTQTDPFVFGAGDMEFTSATRLHSSELNWVWPRGARIEWLAGFRWIELHDQLDLEYSPDFFLRWHEDNHLYGGQLGANLNLSPPRRRLLLDAAVKAGLFGNAANSDFYFVHQNPYVLAPAGGDRAEQTAFVGDLNISAGYRLTRHIALRGGYQFLWLEGLALATEQPSAMTTQVSPSRGIDSSGGLFYHGATASLEIAF